MDTDETGGSRDGDCSLVRVFLNQNSCNGDIGIKRSYILASRQVLKLMEFGTKPDQPELTNSIRLEVMIVVQSGCRCR